MKKLRVIIVDDSLAFRNALKALLQNEYQAEIMGEASNAEEFFAIKNLFLADVIFMDVMLPGVDGITITKQTLWDYRSLKFIAVTMHNETVYLKALLEAGFMGCVFKNTLFEELSVALDSVMNNKRYFPPGILLV